MTNINVPGLSASILTSILPSARHVAVLLGFSYAESGLPYIRTEYNGDTYSIYKKTLPNNFARIDVIYVNDEPIGSVMFVEIAANTLLMIGMFIKKEYRGRKINYKNNNKETIATIASFLLNNVMADLMISNVVVVLEVMNYNKSAYKLYERTVVFAAEQASYSRFELCSKCEILEYNKIRRKRIKRWHDIGCGKDKLGVQWGHIPDYNRQTTWSITRVYCWHNPKQTLTAKPMAFIKNKSKLLWSVVRYGKILAFIYYFLFNRINVD
jgi:hypothetical protein